MMNQLVLQKLLSVEMSAAVRQRGLTEVGGVVVMAGEAVALRTPHALWKVRIL